MLHCALLCHDTVVSVLGNLDVKALLRLGRVSKYFRSIVARNVVVLRAAMLNSFPGISNVPYGMDYSFYLKVLQRYYYYYYYNDNDHHRSSIYRDITPAIDFVEMSLAYHNNDAILLSSDEFDDIIAVFCVFAYHSFASARGRVNIMQFVSRWRTSLGLLLLDQPEKYHVNARAVLDRISNITSTSFHLEQTDTGISISSRISMDVSSIPEISRRKLRIVGSSSSS
jgi:hypothetical protein